MFNRYTIHFSRPPAGRRGTRPERDVNVERLRRFVSSHGLVGELDRIHPASAFGIVQVSCTPLLAERLSEMPEVETVLDG